MPKLSFLPSLEKLYVFGRVNQLHSRVAVEPHSGHRAIDYHVIRAFENEVDLLIRF